MSSYDQIKYIANEKSLRIADLLVLASKNDPFYSGSPASRTNAEWFANLWQRFEFGTGVHLRRVHYVLVSQAEPYPHIDGKPYTNTMESWNRLGEAGKQARYLHLVSPDAFVDRRNPPPHIYRVHEPPPHPSCEFSGISYGELKGIDTHLAWDLSYELQPPSIDVTGYDYSDAADQPAHVEVWVEKSTVNDVLLPLCRHYHVNLVPAVGFQSVTGAINLVMSRAPKGKPVRILYIADFDPAGDFMPQAVARQIEYWLNYYAPDADVALRPLALTREQVQRYRLPRIPIKEADIRKQNFEAAYGEGAVELDALEALYPGELGRLVETAIEPYIDTDLDGEMSDAADSVRHAVKSAWTQHIAEERAALKNIAERATEIYAGYEDRLQRLAADLSAELAPLQEELKSVRHAVQAKMFTFDPDLPPRPVSQLSLPNELDWLFDSKRDYFQQLAVYKARRDTEDAS